MATFVPIAAGLLAFGILYCAWRVWTLLVAWRPAAAVVWSTDYREIEQLDDRWGLGTVRGLRWGDGDNARRIEEVVHYEDAAGERHAASVTRLVRRGRRPDGAHLIWYERARPARATANGPGYWLLIAVALAAGLAALMGAALKMV